MPAFLARRIQSHVPRILEWKRQAHRRAEINHLLVADRAGGASVGEPVGRMRLMVWSRDPRRRAHALTEFSHNLGITPLCPQHSSASASSTSQWP
jgi:hypothetical protein